jgi:hypothetical protein
VLPDTAPTETVSDELHLELRRHFTTRIDSAIRRFVVSLTLDESIEPGLKKAVRRARMVPRLIFPILAGSAAALYFGGIPPALAVAAAGLLCLLSFYLLTKVALTTTQRELIDKLDASSGQLRDLLTQHVTEETQSAFSRFLDLLQPAQQSTSTLEKSLAQQATQLADLGTRFDQIDHSLRALPTTP